MSTTYTDIAKSANPRADAGGYKNVFLFAPRADFLAISKPLDVPVASGDTVTVQGAHTFTDPKGFYEWACQQETVTLKGATVGDPGAQEIEWTGTFNVIGDNASTQEQMQGMLNDDIIALLKDAACMETDQYVQLGDECVSPTFTVEFDGKTTNTGKKVYTVNVKCKVKYFYAHTVTMNAE